MLSWTRVAGSWLAVGSMTGLLVSSGAAAAKSVSITVEGASEPWMAPTASTAAKATFEKLGYQVVESGSPVDTTVTVTVEKAYSHHATSPTFFLLGGFADIWNYDNAHATVTTVVREGDRELARRTASATRRDFPLFAWAQPARHRRTQALRAAVNASLKEYIAGLQPESKQATLSQ